jgi:beta-glucosidase
MVSALLAQMTQAEKIGQMAMVDIASSEPADVTSLFLGAVLASGGGMPSSGNGPSDWFNQTGAYRAAASATRLQVPIIFGIDAVHGNAKVSGATVFPHGIAMGATRDPGLVMQEEQATAQELAALGISMAFSPDSDVGQDERWGRTYESFGEDPMLVSQMVSAAVIGYQGQNPTQPTYVLACPKHALGAGETTWGTGHGGYGLDQGNAEVSEVEMRNVHLAPFAAAIEAGAMAIMISYSSYNGQKMSADTMWLTDVIKGELGYRGFLLSDYDAITQLPGSGQEQESAAINAGLDMIMMSAGASGFIDDVTSLVAAGTIPQSRIDDAVTRILRAKVIAGLFSAPEPTAGDIGSVVGSAAHRQLARQAVRESAVLLKNDDNVLPLSKSAQIAIGGPGAKDLGVQSGGWTIAWQGVTNVTSPDASGIAGTTLLQALQNAAAEFSNVSFVDVDSQSVPSDASVGIAVLYENPYSEYEGDTADPNFNNTLSNSTVAQNPTMHAIYDGYAQKTLAAFGSANIPLVLVLLTGRPVRLESWLSQYPNIKSIVAAWLPGAAGEGLADVLYGDVNFNGILPKSWPKDSTTLPISSLQVGSQALFPFGYGCTLGVACP